MKAKAAIQTKKNMSGGTMLAVLDMALTPKDVLSLRS